MHFGHHFIATGNNEIRIGLDALITAKVDNNKSPAILNRRDPAAKIGRGGSQIHNLLLERGTFSPGSAKLLPQNLVLFRQRGNLLAQLVNLADVIQTGLLQCVVKILYCLLRCVTLGFRLIELGRLAGKCRLQGIRFLSFGGQRDFAGCEGSLGRREVFFGLVPLLFGGSEFGPSGSHVFF